MNQPPKVGIFLKTFKDDLCWLWQGLRSLEGNWHYEPSELLVVADNDCRPEIEKWHFQNLRTLYVEPWPCGYDHSMSSKLSADIYMPKVDLILLFDSDMLLMRPTTLNDLLLEGSPRLVYDVWNSDIDQQTREVSHRVWGPAVRRSMGVDLDRDWMVSPSWLYWASTFAGARSLIEKHCRMPFWQAVYCNHPYDWRRFTEHPMKLCDMQALGVFASQYEAHKYTIVQRSRDMDHGPVTQSWSHQKII